MISARVWLDGQRQGHSGDCKVVRDEGAACVPRPLNETWENLHSVDHHPVLHDALDMGLPPLHAASDREHNSVCSFSSPDLSDDSDAENHKWSGGLSVAEGELTRH